MLFHYARSKFAVGVFILAFAVRLGFLLGFGLEERIYDSLYDQYVYIDIATNLAMGRGFSLSEPVFMGDAGPTSIEPPVYPHILAGLFLIFGSNYALIRVFQAAVSAFTCVIVYHIGKRSIGDGPAKVGALILCIYPPLVMYTRPIMTETISTFFLALSVIWICRLLEAPSVLDSVIAAALWAISFLTRPDIVFYGIAMGVYVLFVWVRDRRQERGLGIIHLIPGVIAFFLVLSPWVIRNWFVHRELVLTTTQKWSVWEANNLRYKRSVSPEWQAMSLQTAEPVHAELPNFSEMTEVQRDEDLARRAWQFIRDHPMLFVKYAASRVHASYPVIPREELPPPFGWNTRKQRPDDGYDYTSLDDFPSYVTFPEKLRVWSFRLVLLFAVPGAILIIRQRKPSAYPLILLVLFNVINLALLRGKERARLIVDPYLVLMGAYFLVTAVVASSSFRDQGMAIRE